MNLDEARASLLHQTPTKDLLTSVTIERGIVGWSLYVSGSPTQANFNSFAEAIAWLHATFTIDEAEPIEPATNVEPTPDPLHDMDINEPQ